MQHETHTRGPLTTQFMAELCDKSPIFAKSVIDTSVSSPSLFNEFAERMLSYAKIMLGNDALQILIACYIEFVIEVNTSQLLYEKRQRYEFQSYQDVFNAVYNNPDCMNKHHWGVFVITFAWKHHLKIVDFFNSQFLPCLNKDASLNLIDLGAGSGIWTLLLNSSLPDVRATLVDISSTSVALTRQLIQRLGLDDRIQVVEGDALTYQTEHLNDIGISCFLLEHLENPGQLLNNLAIALSEGGYAFVTGALTAAEKDHIYEFRRESEIQLLAEEAGFRVIASLSAAPDRVGLKSLYLPRSMAMVLQKRKNLFW